jgi:hypothetical protein
MKSYFDKEEGKVKVSLAVWEVILWAMATIALFTALCVATETVTPAHAEPGVVFRWLG